MYYNGIFIHSTLVMEPYVSLRNEDGPYPFKRNLKIGLHQHHLSVYQVS